MYEKGEVIRLIAMHQMKLDRRFARDENTKRFISISEIDFGQEGDMLQLGSSD
jgi:hypothetical protein